MKTAKDTKKPEKKAKDFKISANNIFINILIGLLVIFILYMAFSIYVKLTRKEAEVPADFKSRPRSEIIQVEVLNGSGVSGLSEKAADYLRKFKFDVVSKGNYESFDILETIVIDRTGNIANAEAVAKALGVKSKIVQQINNNFLLDVTVIIGKDYYNLEALK